MNISPIVSPFGGLGASLGLVLALFSAAPAQADVLSAKAIDLRSLPSIEQVLPVLAEKRVVFVGETHDQYSHHLVQLAIIRALHQRHGEIAIGLEYFQQPFQEHLDAFVAGEIDEKTMLRRTQYMERWRFDYRLYRPILQYARDNRIPLIALNVPKELTAKVAEGGVDKLSAEERATLPELDRGDEKYRERLRSVFEAHPVREGRKFENFLDAQLLWDEGMAERAVDYLKRHPERPMVILAGSGHVAYRDGIPQRLDRRIKLSSAVVLSEPEESLTPDLADFVLLPGQEDLPRKGMMGLLMEGASKGVRVASFAEASAAQAAGMEKDDRIVQIDGETVTNTADVELALLDRKPGETVNIDVLRQAWTGKEKLLRYQVKLR